MRPFTVVSWSDASSGHSGENLLRRKWSKISKTRVRVPRARRIIPKGTDALINPSGGIRPCSSCSRRRSHFARAPGSSSSSRTVGCCACASVPSGAPAKQKARPIRIRRLKNPDWEAVIHPFHSFYGNSGRSSRKSSRNWKDRNSGVGIWSENSNYIGCAAIGESPWFFENIFPRDFGATSLGTKWLFRRTISHSTRQRFLASSRWEGIMVLS